MGERGKGEEWGREKRERPETAVYIVVFNRCQTVVMTVIIAIPTDVVVFSIITVAVIAAPIDNCNNDNNNNNDSNNNMCCPAYS